MASLAAADTGDEADKTGQVADALPLQRPYPASIVNRIVGAIRRAPVPAWTIYCALALVLTAIELTAKWLDGTLPANFQLIHLMLPVYAVTVLPAFDYMDHLAARALDETRPLLTIDNEHYALLGYRLANVPGRATFAAGIGGLLTLALLTAVQPQDTYSKLHIMTSPLGTAVDCGLQFLVWSGVGMVAFHIVHQMRIVNEIYTRYTRISLFTLGPIYAFSRLTAANALFTIAVVAVSSAALASLAGTLQWAVVGGAALVMAAVTFVAPLWGAHRLLAQEKARQQDALAERVEKTIATLQARVDSTDLTGVGDLKTALDGLLLGAKQLEGISTWPWQRETLRGVATGLFTPIALWLITKLLERMGF